MGSALVQKISTTVPKKRPDKTMATVKPSSNKTQTQVSAKTITILPNFTLAASDSHFENMFKF